jgi:hypothetical protein
MKIVRVQAVQAHPVPKRVHEPYGPFPVELFDEPEIIYDYASEDDDGSSSLEPGATAQNNYRPARYFRCRHCDLRVTEEEIEAHICGE